MPICTFIKHKTQLTSSGENNGEEMEGIFCAYYYNYILGAYLYISRGIK